ncbi:MAG: DUF308 domain-containing protein [Oscillospiraceae bacterium]|jgi:uncharacterized membrane protein HdeD (DUF308 family)|nr:DUF308 domain-containing protein [Oscillospiraceae bacterium]
MQENTKGKSPEKAKDVSIFGKILAVVVCLLMLIAGLFIIFNIRGNFYLFPIAIIIYGLYLLIKNLAKKEKRSVWELVLGVLNIIFGVIIFFAPPESKLMGLLMIEFFVAIWAVFIGISTIINSIKFKSVYKSNFIWVLLGGILAVICGLLLFANPLLGLGFLVIFMRVYIAIALVSIGLTGIIAAFSHNESVEAAIEEAIDDVVPDAGE